MITSQQMKISKFTHSSQVGAAISEVWSFVTSPTGINTELMPIMKMTVPQKMQERTISDLQPGEPLGRSWLLLGGLIPFEYDNITLAELEHGKRFLERSTTGSMSHWQHERLLESKSETRTQVTDNIEYTMRIPIPGSATLTKAILQRLFRYRHQQLGKYFEHNSPR